MGMKILIVIACIVAIILAVALAFFVFCVIVSAIKYIHGEMIHTIRNAKRSTRELLWGIEWKFKGR